MKRYGVLDDWRETSVEAGFHAYHEYEHAAYECRFVVERIYPAIIPKGARFFVGLHGDIVSNRMTVYLTEKAALQGRKLGPAQPELHRFAKA